MENTQPLSMVTTSKGLLSCTLHAIVPFLTRLSPFLQDGKFGKSQIQQVVCLIMSVTPGVTETNDFLDASNLLPFPPSTLNTFYFSGFLSARMATWTMVVFSSWLMVWGSPTKMPTLALLTQTPRAQQPSICSCVLGRLSVWRTGGPALSMAQMVLGWSIPGSLATCCILCKWRRL